MTIQTDLSSVRHVGHDRMPTNRRQSECALKLPGLRPLSLMLAALAGGGAVDGGLTAMVKVLAGEGFVCVNTSGLKNLDSTRSSQPISSRAPRSHTNRNFPRRSKFPSSRCGLPTRQRSALATATRNVPGTRDFSNDIGTVNRSAAAWRGQWPGRPLLIGAALRVGRRAGPRVLHPLAKPSGSRVRHPTRWRHLGRVVANRGRVCGPRRRPSHQPGDVRAVEGALNGEMRTSLPLVIYSVE